MEPVNIGIVNIGEAAKASGVSAKMIRHYESIGLLPAAGRTHSGYRTYTESDLHRLRFVKRARNLGFSIKQIENLLALWGDRRRSSAKVKTLTQKHIAELEARIAEMQAMKQALQHLAHQCHGDERPDCPIIEELAA
jgi:Cu(I)-responsive transcriptional regulator